MVDVKPCASSVNANRKHRTKIKVRGDAEAEKVIFFVRIMHSGHSGKLMRQQSMMTYASLAGRRIFGEGLEKAYFANAPASI